MKNVLSPTSVARITSCRSVIAHIIMVVVVATYQCVEEGRYESVVLQVGQGGSSSGQGVGLQSLRGAVHDMICVVEGVHGGLDALVLLAVDGPVVVGVHSLEIRRRGVGQGEGQHHQDHDPGIEKRATDLSQAGHFNCSKQ